VGNQIFLRLVHRAVLPNDRRRTPYAGGGTTSHAAQEVAHQSNRTGLDPALSFGARLQAQGATKVSQFGEPAGRKRNDATSITAARLLGGAPSSAPSRTTIWTGSIQTTNGEVDELRVVVPDRVESDSVLVVPAGATPAIGSLRLSDVRYEGVTARFLLPLGVGSQCALQVVPANSYRGWGAVSAGDSLAMTLAPPLSGMLLPGHEVHLARGAAPWPIAGAASVYVLGARGMWRAVRGRTDLRATLSGRGLRMRGRSARTVKDSILFGWNGSEPGCGPSVSTKLMLRTGLPPRIGCGSYGRLGAARWVICCPGTPGPQTRQPDHRSFSRRICVSTCHT